MTLAQALDQLVPLYRCSGNIDDSTEAQYNALTWNDPRAKPSWSTIQTEMAKEYPGDRTASEMMALCRELKDVLG